MKKTVLAITAALAAAILSGTAASAQITRGDDRGPSYTHDNSHSGEGSRRIPNCYPTHDRRQPVVCVTPGDPSACYCQEVVIKRINGRPVKRVVCDKRYRKGSFLFHVEPGSCASYRRWPALLR